MSRWVSVALPHVCLTPASCLLLLPHYSCFMPASLLLHACFSAASCLPLCCFMPASLLLLCLPSLLLLLLPSLLFLLCLSHCCFFSALLASFYHHHRRCRSTRTQIIMEKVERLNEDELKKTTDSQTNITSRGCYEMENLPTTDWLTD
ncbi:hypothetical protein Pmani_035598 [Petrolisthes manimaculis]|uniref:Uncharacterized protein n=1 Tax=Petrolisthes manimaculis TaxID=1843537 RepID=A0AAE1NM12_9EUCA|nr:hypothetical protein Pmani_035598 [Petrolisthes manimaculis]